MPIRGLSTEMRNPLIISRAFEESDNEDEREFDNKYQ